MSAFSTSVEYKMYRFFIDLSYRALTVFRYIQIMLTEIHSYSRKPVADIMEFSLVRMDGFMSEWSYSCCNLETFSYE